MTEVDAGGDERFLLYVRMSCMVVGSYFTGCEVETKEPSLVH